MFMLSVLYVHDKMLAYYNFLLLFTIQISTRVEKKQWFVQVNNFDKLSRSPKILDEKLVQGYFS